MKKFVKHDKDKVQYHYLEPSFKEGICRVMMYGATKYDPDNWKRANPEEARLRYYDAHERHMEAWRKGEKIDPETGLSHLYHAGCCLMFLEHFER